MRELKLVLGHGNPHFTIHTHLLLFCWLSLFLLFFLFTSTLIYHFPPPPHFFVASSRKQKKFSFETSLVCLSFSPLLAFLFLFLWFSEFPFACLFWAYSFFVFQKLSCWSMCFLCAVLVDHNMSLFKFLLWVLLTWLLLLSGRQKRVAFWYQL